MYRPDLVHLLQGHVINDRNPGFQYPCLLVLAFGLLHNKENISCMSEKRLCLPRWERYCGVISQQICAALLRALSVVLHVLGETLKGITSHVPAFLPKLLKIEYDIMQV